MTTAEPRHGEFQQQSGDLPQSATGDRFHKAASFNSLPSSRSNQDEMNRVRSDSSLMFSMTYSAAVWTHGDEAHYNYPPQYNVASFYDSSDTDSNCDDLYGGVGPGGGGAKPRLWNKSLQNLNNDHQEDGWTWGRDEPSSGAPRSGQHGARAPTRMSQSFTERSRDRLLRTRPHWLKAGESDDDGAYDGTDGIADEFDRAGLELQISQSAAALADVTKGIYDSFASTAPPMAESSASGGLEPVPPASRRQPAAAAAMLDAHSHSFDNGGNDPKSARERRRQLKQSRNLHSQDNLPRLERSVATTRSPDTSPARSPLSTTSAHASAATPYAGESRPDSRSGSQPNSQPGSRPSSRPNSRSQSPQPIALPGGHDTAKRSLTHFNTVPPHEVTVSDSSRHRRRLYSSDDSAGMADDRANIAKARSYGSLPCQYTLPLPGTSGYDEPSLPVPTRPGNLLEVPQQETFYDAKVTATFLFRHLSSSFFHKEKRALLHC